MDTGYIPKTGIKCFYSYSYNNNFKPCFIVGETEDETAFVIEDSKTKDIKVACKINKNIIFSNVNTEVVETFNAIKKLSFVDNPAKAYDISEVIVNIYGGGL